MLTLDQFEAWIKARAKTDKPKDEPWPNQLRAIKQATAIKAHSDTDFFPDFLFKERAPNQTPEQFKYTRANYKCTTHPVFMDYLSTIGKAWIDGNWQINWPEGSDEFKKYVTEELPRFKSLELFMKQVATPLKSVDANGVIAVRPTGFEYIEVDGQIVPDTSKRVTPTVYYHSSADIIVFRPEDLLIALDAERSEIITDGDKVKREGQIFYAYTRNEIFKAEQYGRKSDRTFRVSLWFKHEMDAVPCRQLAGVPMIGVDGEIYWISPFYYAVPLLDMALINKNWLQHMMANCVFPFRVVRMESCDFKDSKGSCQQGAWINIATGEHDGNCPKCKGTGRRVPISPLGEYQWHEGEGLDKGKGPSYSPVEYIEPGDTSVRFVSDQVELDTEGARKLLHLHSSSQASASPDKTATELIIDHESNGAFVRPVSDQLFDLYEWLLNTIAWQRYDGTDVDPLSVVPSIIRPQTFDLRTQADIWAQIKAAKDAGAPPFIMQQLYHDVLNTMNVSDPVKAALYETVVAADRLFGLSGDEVTARKAQSSVEPWQITLHDSGYQLALQLMRDVDGFDTLDLTARIEKINELAKSVTFVPTGGTSVDRIREILNGV